MKSIKIEIKWALIFIVMMLIWMFMERLTGLHDEHIEMHPVFTNFIAIPAILIYVFALLDKKRNYYNGEMSYKQAFVSGLIITAIITLFTPFTQYITSEFITPEYFNNVINYSVKHGMMTQEEAVNYFNLKSYILQSTIGASVMGIITTAIVSIFVRTKSINRENHAS